PMLQFLPLRGRGTAAESGGGFAGPPPLSGEEWESLSYVAAVTMTRTPARPFRSREWFAAPGRSDMAALYLERFMNEGITPDELRSGRPIVVIAQSGSDIAPCNRIHLETVKRVREGVIAAGGGPMEFPLPPSFGNW